MEEFVRSDKPAHVLITHHLIPVADAVHANVSEQSLRYAVCVPLDQFCFQICLSTINALDEILIRI